MQTPELTYTFNKAAKTITFGARGGGIRQESIMMVFNATAGVIIYNPGSPSKGGTVATNVLTLEYDTSAMNDSDKLIILYNDPTDVQPISAASLPLPTGAATQTTLAAILAALKAEDAAAVSGDLGMPLLAMRYAADTTTTSDDGDYTLLKVDEEGRLKVASKPASYADATGDITAVQAVISTPVAGGTVTADVSRASNVMMFCTGTFSTINCTFEGSLESSGDTTWFGIQAVRTNANTIETATGNLSAAPAYAWEASVNGLKRVRVRCTARTSGTQSWRFTLGTYATEPIPAAQISGTQPVSGSVTVSGTVTSTVAAATLALPTTVADVASGALTTTTTTAAITPTAGASYQVVIPVTVVSGTTPTLDVVIQESDDSGTNYYDIYHFPRITATGAYRSPKLPLLGNRIRYVQTVTGTTPSFTRSIGRLQSQEFVDPIRQLFDRTLASTQTLNAVTASLNVSQCRSVEVVVNAATITTTAPAIQLEGSHDNGGTWFALGSPLTAVASSTVRTTVLDTNVGLIRGRVSTAGVSATLGYVMLRGY